MQGGLFKIKIFTFSSFTAISEGATGVWITRLFFAPIN